MKYKKLGRGINQYKRVYYKEISALMAIAFVLFMVSVQDNSTTYVREEVPVVKSTVTTKEEIEDKIRTYFPRSHKTMVAIAKAESGLSMDAQGFNCYYNKDKTIVYETRVKGSHSTACKPSHRKYAWSTDCFVLQKNYKGQKCPKGVTLDEHLEEVAELSKRQHFNGWSAYNNGSYKKYLASK